MGNALKAIVAIALFAFGIASLGFAMFGLTTHDPSHGQLGIASGIAGYLFTWLLMLWAFIR